MHQSDRLIAGIPCRLAVMLMIIIQSSTVKADFKRLVPCMLIIRLMIMSYCIIFIFAMAACKADCRN